MVDLIKVLTLFFALIMFSGCTSLKSLVLRGNEGESKENEFYKTNPVDFSEQLESLGKDYINTPEVIQLKISQKSKNYLNKMYEILVQNNELILNKKIGPKFHIIKERTPFFFSLPKGNFFFSLGLFQKYLKNEGLLLSILASETLKSHQNLYIRREVIPIGYINIEKILSLTRLPFSVKSEINKWAYNLIKRTGLDAHVYLLWLQTLNKNSIDFSLQIGNIMEISREEFDFKSYLVKEETKYVPQEEIGLNSSPDFYNLINEMKRIKL